MVTTSFSITSANKLDEFVYQTAIDGLYYIEHKSFTDERGFYSELARIPEIEKVTGQSFSVKQLNQSRSEQNVIRGIHAENWNKLITVTNGACFCALVDLRKDFKSYSKTETFVLGTEPNCLRGSIFVSSGIGNSFCVTTGPADYVYAVDELYADRDTSRDVAINLFDPKLNISWPIPEEQMIVSDRDRNSVSLSEL